MATLKHLMNKWDYQKAGQFVKVIKFIFSPQN
jgi:hypothetical protein